MHVRQFTLAMLWMHEVVCNALFFSLFMVVTSFVLVVLTKLNFSKLEQFRNVVPPVIAIIVILTLCAFVVIHLHPCIILYGYSSLSKTNGLAAGSEVLL